MQIVENWSQLECRLISVKEIESSLELEVEILGSKPVEGYPNLISPATGSRVRLRLNGPATKSLLPERFSIRARKAGPDKLFADQGSITPVERDQ